jgi:hypothetical protein
MLFEMRVMNHNFGLMYKAQLEMMHENKQHMSRIEEKINLSSFVNTSVGLENNCIFEFPTMGVRVCIYTGEAIRPGN